MAEHVWDMGDDGEREIEDAISEALVAAVRKKIDARLQEEINTSVRAYVAAGFLCIDEKGIGVAFYSGDPIEAVQSATLVDLIERELGHNMSDGETFETAEFAPWNAETIVELEIDAADALLRSENLKRLRECWRVLKAP